MTVPGIIPTSVAMLSCPSRRYIAVHGRCGQLLAVTRIQLGGKDPDLDIPPSGTCLRARTKNRNPQPPIHRDSTGVQRSDFIYLGSRGHGEDKVENRDPLSPQKLLCLLGKENCSFRISDQSGEGPARTMGPGLSTHLEGCSR